MFSSQRISGYILLTLLSALLLAGGCAPKDTGLTLRYAPVGRDTGDCAAKVGIGQIADNRGGMKAIGDKDQEVRYYPIGPAVTEWVHDALVVEFKARGCDAAGYVEGSPFAGDWVVSGDVLSVYMSQTGMFGTKLHLKMRFVLDRALAAGGAHAFEKIYEGTWERTSLNLSQERSEALFQEALGDLLRDVVPELTAAMR